MAAEFQSREATAKPRSIARTIGQSAVSVGVLYLALLLIRAIHSRLGSSTSSRMLGGPPGGRR
jgi:hypothetical protein